MAVRKQLPFKEGIYFITFTCSRWLPLFEEVNAYEEVYKQFDILKSEGHYIIGYVIMPNHLHALIAFKNSGKGINRRIGTLKRFLAYELVKRLQNAGKIDTLKTLSDIVNDTDRSKGKMHEVFEPSFDWKECASKELIVQKLDYMHANPCKGVWRLVDSPVAYVYSSAKFYLTGEQGDYPVTGYMHLQDISLDSDL